MGKKVLGSQCIADALQRFVLQQRPLTAHDQQLSCFRLAAVLQHQEAWDGQLHTPSKEKKTTTRKRMDEVPRLVNTLPSLAL